MSKEQYKETAKELSKWPLELIKRILETNNEAILEEMHDQLKKQIMEIERLIKKIERLNDIIDHLVKGLNNQIGTEAVQKLLEQERNKE